MIVNFQDRSSLVEATDESKGEAKMFVMGAGPVRVAAACRGPKAERARRRMAKVAPTVATTESSNEAASRPSGQRAVAPFQAAERRSASRQRFVVRAGRRIVGMVSSPHRVARGTDPNGGLEAMEFCLLNAA